MKVVNVMTLLLFQLLISSDSMARGMDVEGVGGVVNYEAPHQFKTYLHRVGRTARAGERGVAYTLLAPEEVRGPFLIYLLAIGCRREDCISADHEYDHIKRH